MLMKPLPRPTNYEIDEQFKAKKAKHMTFSECLEFFCETKNCKKTYCAPVQTNSGFNLFRVFFKATVSVFQKAL